MLRHELLKNQCHLIEDPKINEQKGILIHGDINNLVQVMGNLVSNAIDAQKPEGRHDIVIETQWDEDQFQLMVKDYGTGISKNTQAKLFHQMVTSKGTKGTGLGIFISNSVIHAKFGGSSAAARQSKRQYFWNFPALILCDVCTQRRGKRKCGKIKLQVRIKSFQF